MRLPARHAGRLSLIGVLLAGLVTVAPAPAALGAIGAWSASGPLGGADQQIAVDPSHHATVWAAMGNGLVYRSTDGGITWTPRHRGIPGGIFVTAVSVAPSNSSVIYAGTIDSLDGTMYVSTNGGARWHHRGTGFAGGVHAIVVHPTNANIAYAATYTSVFKTTNGGLTWSDTNLGVGLGAYGLAMQPGHPKTLYAATGYGVYRTTDSAGSWHLRSTGLSQGVSSFAFDPTNPIRVFAGTYGSSVYETVDSGGSWTPVNTTGLPNDLVDVVATDPSNTRLYAVDRDNGVFTLDTANELAGWTSANGGIASPSQVTTLSVDRAAPKHVFVGLQVGGIMRSTNRAASWSRARKGLRATEVLTEAVDPTNPSVVYAAVTNGAGVFRSTDRGVTWTRRSSGLPAFPYITVIAISPSNHLVLYAGDTSGAGVYRSADGGASWQATSTTESIESMAVSPSDPNTVWIGTASVGVLKTINGGGLWTPANTNLPDEGIPGFYMLISALAVSPSDANVLYAGGYQKIFKSIDGAATWTEPSTDLAATAQINDLAVHPSGPGVVYAVTDGFGVYRTGNGGANWAPRGLSGKHATSVVIDPAHPETVYVGLKPGGVFRSINSGGAWAAFNHGLDLSSVLDIALSHNGRQLYAATQGGGVFSYRLP